MSLWERFKEWLSIKLQQRREDNDYNRQVKNYERDQMRIANREYRLKDIDRRANDLRNGKVDKKKSGFLAGVAKDFSAMGKALTPPPDKGGRKKWAARGVIREMSGMNQRRSQPRQEYHSEPVSFKSDLDVGPRRKKKGKKGFDSGDSGLGGWGGF